MAPVLSERSSGSRIVLPTVTFPALKAGQWLIVPPVSRPPKAGSGPERTRPFSSPDTAAGPRPHLTALPYSDIRAQKAPAWEPALVGAIRSALRRPRRRKALPSLSGSPRSADNRRPGPRNEKPEPAIARMAVFGKILPLAILPGPRGSRDGNVRVVFLASDRPRRGRHPRLRALRRLVEAQVAARPRSQWRASSRFSRDSIKTPKGSS